MYVFRSVNMCDSCPLQTLPIIPNLLPFLLNHDASLPTYFGSATLDMLHIHRYFQGMMYGWSWSVVCLSRLIDLCDEKILILIDHPIQVKTLAMAEVTEAELHWNTYEDYRSGLLMVCVPRAMLFIPYHQLTSNWPHPFPHRLS